MQNGDIGLPVGSPIGDGASAQVPTGGSGGFAGFADKVIAVTGTFGVAATCVCEGSNDAGANYFTLTDPLANPISFTTASGAGLKAITEAVLWLRPHVTSGDGTTSLTAAMFFRKTQTP
jgi:hypothetical protein